MAYTYSDLMKVTYTPGDVAILTGKTLSAIQKWDNKGVLIFERTKTNRRFITRENLIAFLKQENLFYETTSKKQDVIYARVSSHKQKVTGDLDRQITYILEKRNDLYNPIVLKEVGSGLNDKRAQIQKLIKMIANNEVGRIFVTYKDRLTRFGFNYISLFCELHGVEIIVIKDENKHKSIAEELTEDMMSLLASFSGKLYGLRSHSNKSEGENEK